MHHTCSFEFVDRPVESLNHQGDGHSNHWMKPEHSIFLATTEHFDSCSISTCTVARGNAARTSRSH